MDSSAHRSEADRPALGWRRDESRNGLAVTRDEDIFAGFDGPKQFGEMVFGVGDGDIHNFDYSQKK